mgnify:CR=1 FL=1
MSEKSELVFFIDRCLGKKKVAEALRNAGAKVEIHDDHFTQDISDVEWLGVVGERNWVVLTKDENIGYRTSEQLAVAEANVRVFVLVSTNISGQKMADTFVKTLDKMQKFALNNPAPFMAKVYQSGRVIMWKKRKVLLKKITEVSPDSSE